MPCDSSYLEPSDREIESKKCAENIVYVHEAMGWGLPSAWIVIASQHTYGNVEQIDTLFQSLCIACRVMDEKDKERVIYNAKDKRARQLADWWEEHQKADKERKERESLGRNLV